MDQDGRLIFAEPHPFQLQFTITIAQPWNGSSNSELMCPTTPVEYDRWD